MYKMLHCISSESVDVAVWIPSHVCLTSEVQPGDSDFRIKLLSQTGQTWLKPVQNR